MSINIQLEWGNRAHINLVHNYDLRMRGIKTCVIHRFTFCTITFLDDHLATPIFHQTTKPTLNIYAVVECPQCLERAELVFSKEYAEEWEYCECGVEFEIRKSFDPYAQKEVDKVYVKQEVAA